MIKELFELQQDIPVVEFDAYNPHYKSKYATLTAIMNALKPLLKRHGFVVSHKVFSDSEATFMNTVLIHVKSNERIESGPMRLQLEKSTMQSLGSSVSYARRYQLSALLGIVSDEDTDAAHENKSQETTVKPTVKPKEAEEPKPKEPPRNIAKGLVELQGLVKKSSIDPLHVKRCISLLFDKNNSSQLNTDQISELISFLKGDPRDRESFLLELEKGQKS